MSRVAFRKGVSSDEPKLCRKCYGISNNRPITGKCICGESYAPELIAINLDDRNPGKLAIVSESRQRIEATCNP